MELRENWTPACYGSLDKEGGFGRGRGSRKKDRLSTFFETSE